MPEAEIADLTPFFSDPCWMFCILARKGNVGVILRRGPTEWWRVTQWNTKRDTFEPGQWFRGRIYPEKCDVSPDGKLFVYFAGKFWRRNRDAGHGDTWTAVSRPPYLTALALWPIGRTYSARTLAYARGSEQSHDREGVVLSGRESVFAKPYTKPPPRGESAP